MNAFYERPRPSAPGNIYRSRTITPLTQPTILPNGKRIRDLKIQRPRLLSLMHGALLGIASLREFLTQDQNALMRLHLSGSAEKRTRTSTPLRGLEPESDFENCDLLSNV